MIYMTHPEHGAMNVGNEEAALEHEKLGWKRDVWKSKAQMLAEAQAAKVVDAQNTELPQEDDIRKLYEEKYGHPPHHRMKDETIKAALDDNA